MSELGSFNFTLGLDTNKLDQGVEKAKKKLNEIRNQDIELTIKDVSLSTSAISKIKSQLENEKFVVDFALKGNGESQLKELTDALKNLKTIGRTSDFGVGIMDNAKNELKKFKDEYNSFTSQLAKDSGNSSLYNQQQEAKKNFLSTYKSMYGKEFFGDIRIADIMPYDPSKLNVSLEAFQSFGSKLEQIFQRISDAATQSFGNVGTKIESLSANLTSVSQSIISAMNKIKVSGVGSASSTTEEGAAKKTADSETTAQRYAQIVESISKKLQDVATIQEKISSNKDFFSPTKLTEFNSQLTNIITELVRIQNDAQLGGDGKNIAYLNSASATQTSAYSAVRVEANRLINIEKQRQKETEKENALIEKQEEETSNSQTIAQRYKQIYEAVNKKLQEIATIQAKINGNTNLLNSSKVTEFNAQLDRAKTSLEKIQQEAAKGGNGKNLATLNSASATQSSVYGAVRVEANRLMDAEKKRQQTVAAETALIAGQLPLLSEYNNRVSRGNSLLNYQKRVLSEVGGIIATSFSAYSLQSFLKSVVTIGGEFEKQKVALQSILQSEANAQSLYNEIQGLAIKSPFTFKDLVGDAKQLSAYSIPFNELYDTTKRLADLSAGLGVDMNRLILAYGQVRSASVLRGQELRQFTEAGVPMVDALAKKLSDVWGRAVSTAEVFDAITKKQVPFEYVKEVLFDMTNEGGNFYNMQEKMADTIAGKWSNLGDAWDIMLADMANSNDGFIKSTLGLVTSLMKNWQYIVTPLLVGGVSKMIGAGINKFSGTTATRNEVGSFMSAKAYKANELQNKSFTVDLDDKESEFLKTRNEITEADLKTLSANKKLTQSFVDEAVKQKLLTAETKANIATMGLLDAKTGKVIVTTETLGKTQGKISTLRKAFFGLGNAISAAGKALKSLVMDNIVTLSIMAAVEAFMKLREASEESNQHIENVKNSLADMYKTMREYAKSEEGFDPMASTEDVVIEHIKNMTTKLKDTLGDSASLIINEAYKKHGETVQSVYEYLSERMENLNLTDNEIASIQDKISSAYNKMSGTGWLSLNDAFTTNIKDMADGVTDYIDLINKRLSGLDDSGLKDLLDKMMQYGEKNKLDFKMLINGLNPKDYKSQIDAIVKSFDGFEALYNSLGDSKSAVAPLVNSKYLMNYQAAQKQVDQMFEGLKEQFNVEKGEDFSNLGDNVKAAIIKDLQTAFESDPSGQVHTLYIETLKNWFGITPQEMEEISNPEMLMNSLQKTMMSYLGGTELKGQISTTSDFFGIKDLIQNSYKNVSEKLPEITKAAKQQLENAHLSASIINADDATFDAQLAKIASKIVNSLTSDQYSIYVQYGATFSKIKEAYENAINPDAVKKGLIPDEKTRQEIISTYNALFTKILSSLVGQGTVFDILLSFFNLKNEKKGLEDAAKSLGVDAGGKIKTKKKSGSQKDQIAETWRKRVDAINGAVSAYDNWKKVVGAEGAKEHVSNDAEYGTILKDLKDKTGISVDLEHPRQALEAAYKKLLGGSTLQQLEKKYKERYSLALSIKKNITSAELKDMQEAVKLRYESAKSAWENETKNWNVFQSIYNSTGNKQLAIGVSGVNTLDATDDLSEAIMEDFTKMTGKDYMTVLGWYNDIGGEGQKLYASMTDTEREYFLSHKKEMEDQVKSDKQKLAEILETYATNYDKIASIERDRTKQLGVVNRTGINDSNLTDKINSSADLEKYKLTSDYYKLFNATLSLSGSDADKISKKVLSLYKAAFDSNAISAEDYANAIKDVNDALQKLKEGAKSDFELSFFKDYDYTKLDKLNDQRNAALKSAQEARQKGDNGNEQMYLREAAAIQKDIDKLYDYSEATKELKRATSRVSKFIGTISKSISTIASGSNNTSLNAISSVLEGLQGAFDSIGEIDLSSGTLFTQDNIDAINNASASIMSAANQIKDIREQRQQEEDRRRDGYYSSVLNILGDIEDDIVSRLSTTKISDYSEEINTLRATYEANIETAKQQATNALGARVDTDEGWGHVANHSVAALMWAGAQNYHNYNDGEFDNEFPGLSQIKDQLEAIAGTTINGAYDLLNLSADKMREIWERYASTYFSGTDNEDFYKYYKNLMEAKEDLEELENTAMSNLLGFDTESFESSWLSLMQDMDSTTQDFADNFEKYLRNAIMNVALTSYFKDDIDSLNKKMYEYMVSGDEITSEEADSLRELSSSLTERIKNYTDTIDDTLGFSSSSSSSLSSSIAGVTEQTADILASYLNAVRADVSVIRTNYDLFGTALSSWLIDEKNYNIGTIAQSQLDQLNAIAIHTENAATQAANIYDLLESISNGTKKLYTSL